MMSHLKKLSQASLMTATFVLTLTAGWASSAKAQTENPAQSNQPATQTQDLTPVPMVNPDAYPATTTNPSRQTTSPVQPSSARPGEAPYDYYMRLGYAASKRDNPRVAIQYFRNAIAVRPGDRLATIAFWNMYDQLVQTEGEPQTVTANTQTEPQQNQQPLSDYDAYMNQGYNATDAGNYTEALQFFRQALQLRPNDAYAAQAIRNVRSYIVREAGNQQSNLPSLRRPSAQ